MGWIGQVDEVEVGREVVPVVEPVNVVEVALVEEGVAPAIVKMLS